MSEGVPGSSEERNAVKAWVDLAEQDFRVSARLLQDVDTTFFRSVAFHAQQCAEKYLKAYLVHRGVAFPKTHDLGRLLQLIVESGGLPQGLSLDSGSVLNRYGVSVRYPDDVDPVEEQEARDALESASLIRNSVRSAFII